MLATLLASWLALGCDSAGHSSASAGGAAGSGGDSSMAASAGTTAGGGGAAADSLAQKYRDYFPIGAAVDNFEVSFEDQVLAQDFNHLTCENAMKMEDIHPAEDVYGWLNSDRIADFARQHGMKLTGHTLLWHRQAPDWMFEGVTAGDAESLELLKSRLKAHIETVIDRYADVVDNWDVVNEVISDDPSKTYRDGTEGSKWYELFGSQEYVYWAYQFAHDALEAKEPGSSAGKLYYNEYNVTLKADHILEMLAWLKDEKGITVDGVGFQSHENINWPSVGDIQTALDKFKAAGYKAKISELDISMYDDYATGSFVPSPQIDFTPDVEQEQARRFADLFALYRKNKDQITSVTFWGISDDQTWLDGDPVEDRDDFPLLYNDAHQPKAARAAIMDF